MPWEPHFIALQRQAREARREAGAAMISAGIDLQPTTYELLHCLADDTGDLTQHDLQREMHCAKSTLSESVTTAARRGLIRRYVGADKRYRKVKLTNRGRVMLEEARRELKASVPAPR